MDTQKAIKRIKDLCQEKGFNQSEIAIHSAVPPVAFCQTQSSH